MTVSAGSSQSLRAEIQQCLVESGNYEAISNELTERLLKDGWFDDVKKLTKDQIMKDNDTKFSSVIAKVEPEALDLIQQSTKDTIMQKIMQFLDEIVDTE